MRIKKADLDKQMKANSEADDFRKVVEISAYLGASMDSVHRTSSWAPVGGVPPKPAK
jgi:hypothetical protein